MFPQKKLWKNALRLLARSRKWNKSRREHFSRGFHDDVARRVKPRNDCLLRRVVCTCVMSHAQYRHTQRKFQACRRLKVNKILRKNQTQVVNNYIVHHIHYIEISGPQQSRAAISSVSTHQESATRPALSAWRRWLENHTSSYVTILSNMFAATIGYRRSCFWKPFCSGVFFRPRISFFFNTRRLKKSSIKVMYKLIHDV